MLILSIIVIMFLSTFVSAVDCTDKGLLPTNKFVGGSYVHSDSYTPLSGYNVSDLEAFYPNNTTSHQSLINPNAVLTDTWSFSLNAITIQPDTTYLQVTYNLVDSTNASITAQECDTYKIIAEDQGSSSFLKGAFITVLFFSLVFILLFIFFDSWNRLKNGQEMNFAYLITGLVLLVVCTAFIVALLAEYFF